MAEVAGGEGVETNANAVAAQTADKGISFVDGESGADSADAILDEVLAGGDANASTEGTQDVASTESVELTPTQAPAAKTEPAKAPSEPPQDAQLRKGFAKLAEERQKLIEQQNAVRQERAAVQQYAAKAEAHDKLMARLREDPAGVIAELGAELVDKTLQGFIDREKSPAERETAKLRADIERDKAERLRQEQERVAAQWRNDITAKVQGDERFDLVNSLGLHGAVIDVITGYYEKHSERDDNGNVTVPAILDWTIAAQAVEDHRASLIERSKRYGKRAPAAETPVSGKPKDAPAAKTTPAAPAKKPPTSLSSVPVAEGPSKEEDFPIDDMDERQRRVLASLGIS